MKVERYKIQACCGRTSIIFKTDRSIVKEDIDKFVLLGFKEAKNFTAAGILYVDNSVLLLTAPLGSDRLTCKIKLEKDQEQKLNDIEDLLLTI